VNLLKEKCLLVCMWENGDLTDHEGLLEHTSNHLGLSTCFLVQQVKYFSAIYCTLYNKGIDVFLI